VPTSSSDYLLRMIEQIFRLIRRILALKRGGRVDEALAEVQAARAELFGPVADLLPRLDAETAAQVLTTPARIVAWARLLREEAALHRLRGDAALADACERQAAAVTAEAERRDPDAARAALARLDAEAEDPSPDPLAGPA
jgi:hypothetical protein